MRGIDGGLGVERVEDGFHQQGVHSAFEQGLHLFGVGLGQVVEGEGAEGGVVDVGTEGEGLVGGAHGACHVAGAAGTGGGVFVGHAAGQAGSGEVDVAHGVLGVVVGLADAGGVEGVGLDDVGPGIEVAAVDGFDDVGPGEAQKVVVAEELAGQVGEAVAPEVGFREAVALYHSAHGTVEDEDAGSDGIHI